MHNSAYWICCRRMPTLLIVVYHNRLSVNVGRQRQSLWFTIRALKDEHVNVSRSALQAERGVPPPRRRPKWRRLQRRIRHLKAEYAAGQRSLQDYWSAVVHGSGLYVNRILRRWTIVVKDRVKQRQLMYNYMCFPSFTQKHLQDVPIKQTPVFRSITGSKQQL